MLSMSTKENKDMVIENENEEEEERRVATDGIQADETSSFLITEGNINLFTLLTTIENG